MGKKNKKEILKKVEAEDLLDRLVKRAETIARAIGKERAKNKKTKDKFIHSPMIQSLCLEDAEFLELLKQYEELGERLEWRFLGGIFQKPYFRPCPKKGKDQWFRPVGSHGRRCAHWWYDHEMYKGRKPTA